MMSMYDVADWTAFSESDPRNAAIDTLQVHHSTTTNRAAARALYAPGGRVVSPNDQLHLGVLYGIVPQNRRAFTSGSPAQDHRSFTVEVDNITLAPEWGIGTLNHERLAQLLATMYLKGLVKKLAYGVGGIIGHRDVPGSYPTACPGPSMIFDWIINRAKKIIAKLRKKKGHTMYFVKPNSKFPAGFPNTRIRTDGRHKEVVTDPAMIAQLDFMSTRTDGPPTLLYDKANWDAMLEWPDFPTGTGGGGGSGPTAAQIATAVDEKLTPRFSSITSVLSGIVSTLNRIFK